MSLDRTMPVDAPARPAPARSGGGNAFIALLLPALAALHVWLIFLLPDAQTRFMLGDRAHDRTFKLETLLRADGLEGVFAALVRQGSPGDYVLFAPAYWLAGPTGVMLQNTGLILLGVFFLYRLAGLFFSPRVAAIAAIAYALLPATLFHPHAFVTEAICNPALIAASFFLARYASAERPAGRDLVLAAALAALLAFTRHVYLLLPLFFAGVLLLARPVPRGGMLRALALLLGIGYSLVAVWGAAAHLGAAHYGGGKSVGGLGSNLHLRAERMAAMGGFALPGALREQGETDGIRTLRPGEFLGLVADHPAAFAGTIASDAFNIAGNPGVAMVFGRFLGVFDLGEDDYRDYSKWREIRDTQGVTGLLRELWRVSPVGLIVNAAGALAWLAFVCIALYGAWRLVTDRAQPLALKLLLPGLPAYLMGLACIAAGYTRWDHRSPAEFAVALLFAVGIAGLGARDAPAPQAATEGRRGESSRK